MSMPAMPSWTMFRVVLRACAPIHIGFHSLGLIARTRYFIHARAIWGVLTAGLTQRLSPQTDGAQMYKIGRELYGRSIRFTPFFALTHSNKDEDVLRPHFDRSKGLTYGAVSVSEFERRFLSSFTSTALDVNTFGHEDGALHESEYLSPWSTDDPPQPLRFAGYVFLRDDINQPAVFDTLKRCWVGADRRYGWGALEMVGQPQNWASKPLFGEFQVAPPDPEKGPVIEPLTIDSSLPAYTCFADGLDHHLEGAIEVVSGRNWQPDNGPGQDEPPPARICWAPGSRLRSSSLQFTIDEEGFWSVFSPPANRTDSTFMSR